MIWLIAILLLAVFAGLGYLKGSIQMGISVLGLFVGVMLAMPMAPMMLPIYTASGVTNMILLAVLPPITAFIVVGLVFMIIGIVVHLKVRKYFRYKTDEASQLMFKRLNARIGAAFGLVAGVFYSVVLGVGIYSAGYLTYQVSTESDPGWLKFITETRVAMDSNGLAKMAAALDPMPKKFYEVSDLIGLSHRNPLLENRYRNYPPFLKLGDRADIQEIGGDSEFHGMLVQQASLAEIMKHPLGQKVMANRELFDILVNQTDLEDLRTYLEEGESPKYAEQRILGRWELNGNALINHTKRNTAGIKSSQMRAVIWLVENVLDGASLIVYPDNQLVITPSGGESEDGPGLSMYGAPGLIASPGLASGAEAIHPMVLTKLGELFEQLRDLERAAQEKLEAAARARQSQQFGGAGRGGMPQMDAEMQARYGLTPGGGGAGGEEGEEEEEEEGAQSTPFRIGSDGNWERKASGRYELEIDGFSGITATINKNRLLIKSPVMNLLFSRVY